MGLPHVLAIPAGGLESPPLPISLTGAALVTSSTRGGVKYDYSRQLYIF